MKYVVAVSGGVDSVVLLDMMSKNPYNEIIVAHFDHGIRDDSANDAEFVGKLAKKYGFKYEKKREDLGKNTSEELARRRRYEFLKEMAVKHNATLVTAHHADDVIETVVINLIRGTGWRGLAVLDSGIYRPLTDMFKSDILYYAKENNLTWHEDSTNQSDDYLRNRVRRQTINLDLNIKHQILELWKQQKILKSEIDTLIDEIMKLQKSPYERALFSGIHKDVAMELFRYITNGKLTRPQIGRLIEANATMKPSKIFQVGAGINVKFTARNFTIELIK